jgi:hypothetical protein
MRAWLLRVHGFSIYLRTQSVIAVFRLQASGGEGEVIRWVSGTWGLIEHL